MEASTVQIFAPSKLTVSLHITGVRDDGYHFIDAEMVTLDFGDDLEITPSHESTVTMVDQGVAVAGESNNLVYQALALAERTASVTVTKNIPAGAGLGGGSADAAAILRWAGYSNTAGAVVIGADVPFCLVGGRARVTGIGELIEPLDFQVNTYTLLTAPFHCSTPAVYQQWDAVGGPHGPRHNDLETAAIAAYPELAIWRDKLGEATGVEPQLAGSGSTWFVEGAFEGIGRIAQTLPPHTMQRDS